MKLYRNKSGLIKKIPFYKTDQLDQIFENIINSYFLTLDRELKFPISTDDLTKLIEQQATDLDLYADLSGEGLDVEGVTYFIPGEKPSVCISSKLSTDSRYSNRFRTTLAHEFAHIILHKDLISLEKDEESDLAYAHARNAKLVCDEKIVHSTANTVSSLEWQANYGCGALLMPVTPFTQLMTDYEARYTYIRGTKVNAYCNDPVIAEIVHKFNVSKDAAKVRLVKLRYCEY